MAMIAQKSLLRAGASVLALAGMISKLNSKFSEEGSNKAKKGYEKAANTKKENNELAKRNIKQVVEKKEPQLGELAGAEEKVSVENKVADNTNQQKQKFILSEEGAYFPIKAENTETKIQVDEDVKGLIQVKQKNLKRSAAASKARIAYLQSKGYENDFPIRDYLPNVQDKDLYKAGITKTELNKLSSIIAGNGTEKDVQNWFEKHNASDSPIINMDSLNISEDTAKEIKRLIIDKDTKSEAEQYEASEWQNNFIEETENYKVWEDPKFSEEDKESLGIVF